MQRLALRPSAFAACVTLFVSTGVAWGASCTLPCPAGKDCQLVMPLTFDAEQAVLTSTRSLELGDGSRVIAGRQSDGEPNGAVANLGKASTTVGSNASLGGLFSNANVSLGAAAVVSGSLKTGGTLSNPSGAVIKGSVTTHTPIPIDRHVLATVSFTTGTTNVTVPSGTTRTLGAGRYGATQVNAGGTLSLSAGTYYMTSLAVASGATLDLNETDGAVVIYLQNTFTFAGKEAETGGEGHVLVAIFGCASDVLSAAFRGTVSAQSALLSLKAVGFVGKFLAEEIELGPKSSVTGLPPTLPTPPRSDKPTVAHLPPRLPAPPNKGPGCYQMTRNGWQSIPCTPNEIIDQKFGHPDAQLSMTSSAIPTLVYGQLAVTVPAVSSEQNAFLASTASIKNCTSSGAAVPNQWSIQNNTNQWSIPSTSPSRSADSAQTQFVISSNGTNSAICIWNIEVSTHDYSHKTCFMTSPAQRAGGLQPFDFGNLAASVAGGSISLVAQLSWVPPGTTNLYAFVAPDTYNLGSNWSAVSGGLLGLGNCSQAQLTQAQVVTEIAASTCVGDTDATSPTCPPPLLQPNANVFTGGIGTVETSNLVAVGTPAISYPNDDLAVTSQVSSTSGNCVGSGLAYVKDNPADFGATPSNLGNEVFWESPDLFLVPHGTPVDLTSVSTETTITPGGQFDIWVRVHNDLGCANVNNVTTMVYLADPAALSIQWNAITNNKYVGPNGGTTGVTAPAGGAALIGPIPFTAPTSGIGDGHKCIIAAIQGTGEAAPAKPFDAPDSNQVAQRNVQFANPCIFPLTNGTALTGSVDITLSVTPNMGTQPSLTSGPDVQVSFDDTDSSWFNVWNSQPGNGSTFQVTHSASTNQTVVRLASFSVTLNQVQLAAGQTRNATGTTVLPPGFPTGVTLQIGAQLSETTSGGNTVVVSNGGSCVTPAPPIVR